MTSTHSRAKKGGELGANGEWYEGGTFINTVEENPKGSPQLRVKPAGKQEVEPYKWEIAPEGKRSLYRLLAGIEYFDRGTMQFRFNDGLRLDYATPEAIALRKSRIASFNAGQRWI